MMRLPGFLQNQQAPIKIRLYYVSIFVVASVLTWSSYLGFMQALESTRIEDLEKRSTLETLLFEDYAARSLDVVQSVLNSMTMLTNPQAIKSNRFTPEFLKESIETYPIIRSISLVDENGIIVASSETKNLKVRLTPEQMGALRITPENLTGGYGRVRNRRDFYPEKSPVGSDVSFWPISREILVDQAVYKWVASINLSLYQNLWIRSDAYPSTDFGLVDLAGNWIVHTNKNMDPDVETSKVILNALRQKELGVFQTGDRKNGLMIAYRVSKDHPIVMVSMNDMRVFETELASIRSNRFWIAVAVTLFMGLIVGVLFLTYRRYESTATEANNQSQAISAHLMMSEFSTSGIITNINDQLVQISGFSKEEVIGQPFQVFDNELYPNENGRDLFASIEAGEIWQGVYRKRKKSGEFYWVNATIIPFKDVWGRITYYRAYYTDITQAISIREQYENERRIREELTHVNRELVKDSNTDPLTKLFNRRAFDAFIEQAIKTSKERTQPLSILMLDLDFFKKVNDTYGHAAGDMVLKESGKRWLEQIRSSDMLARIGGEEFCVVLPETTLAQAELVAEKIILATRENLYSVKTADGGTQSFPVTVSIGIASTDHFPEGFSTESFMNVADGALYFAKSNGRNQFASRRVQESPLI